MQCPRNEQQLRQGGGVPIESQNPVEEGERNRKTPSPCPEHGHQTASTVYSGLTKTSVVTTGPPLPSKDDPGHSRGFRPQQQAASPCPPSSQRASRLPLTHHRQAGHHHHHPHRPPPPHEVLPGLHPTSLGWPLAVHAPSPTTSYSSSSAFPPARAVPPSLSLGLYQDNNPEPVRAKSPPLPPMFRHGCRYYWRWSMRYKSGEVTLTAPERTTAVFHPNWSNGTAGVCGTKPINHGVYYWEIQISNRLFGTSMMFGVATRKACLHMGSFCNLLGKDRHSWALSHKGLAWHKGRSVDFCPPFAENQAVCVGMVYDATEGTLTYYKDGVSLGVAFRGLNLVEEDLYPALCSTAARTEMTLGVTRRAFRSLQDRCRAAVARQLRRVGRAREVEKLPLPGALCRYISEDIM
ncbi:hypothetical protein ACOMHN_046410 [Nucella lapillus]